jgi:hypothetical protein
VSRRQPVPAYLESAVNLHLVSDVHCQADPTASLRIGKVLDDCDRMIGRQAIDAHVVMGDLMDQPVQSEADLWRAWRGTLEGNSHPRDVYACLGNHDVWDGRTDFPGNPRWTPSLAATALGLPGASYTADLGEIKLIVLGMAEDQATQTWTLTIDAAGLAFLDTELGNTTKPCLVVFHGPLFETVDGPPGWASYEPYIHAHPDPPLRQILDAHPNAVAWLSGHTHAPIETPRAVGVVDLGSHKLATINVTGLWYTMLDVQPHDPLRGMLLSVLDEHTMEVRFRDHGAGVWTAPTANEHLGKKVVTLTV